jgi:sulfate adenylyltransferase
LSRYSVKPKYQKLLKTVISQNNFCKKKVRELKTKFRTIGAFQTRNIPHYGHEAIISKMLKVCDHLVINPVVGPKKKGDVTLSALDKVFNFLSLEKYNSRISFIPIMCNMFYAGPFEALHHATIRQRLGFDFFSVGRDHAGADAHYAPLDAVNYLRKNSCKLNINVICHNGAAFCKSCKKYVLVGDCSCEISNHFDIAGTDFRAALQNQKIFRHADKELQEYIQELDMELFET